MVSAWETKSWFEESHGSTVVLDKARLVTWPFDLEWLLLEEMSTTLAISEACFESVIAAKRAFATKTWWIGVNMRLDRAWKCSIYQGFPYLTRQTVHQ